MAGSGLTLAAPDIRPKFPQDYRDPNSCQNRTPVRRKGNALARRSSAATVAAVAIGSLIVAVVAIVIALASVSYTRRQAVASEAAAAASKSTAALEGERRHEELTPQLAITAAQPDADSRSANLTLELTGPPGLGGLDEVMVRIRDDRPDRKPGPASQLTEEQISEVIWGPYRLNPGMRDTDSAGRAHGPFPLPVHEPYRLELERTIAPSWAPRGWWAGQYQGEPVRLEVICTREGYEPWVVLREVEVKSPPEAYAV
jgi:hypothetical protein